MISTRFSLIYVTLSIMTFLFLSMQYNSSLFCMIDHKVALFISTIFSKDMQSLFIFITDIGSYKVTFPLLVIVTVGLLLSRKFLFTFLFIFNFYSVRLLNNFLKEFFHRERPPIADRLVEAHNYSFPSGHSMNSIAIYGLLCWLVLHFPLFRHTLPRMLVIIGTSLLVLLIGVSRIYLKVHFATDVFAGFLAGSAWFLLLTLLYHSYQKYRQHSRE
ncbi:phosphatase PAP2 family protein [Bacillus sp. BGMRC 2118]|nr:phosphatase PAP2 family protein [Bacillus sp. BGMRC 2118]